MINLSTGLRNYLAITGPLTGALTGKVIRIYGGATPANADASLGTATLLCTITGAPSGIEFEPTATAGVLLKSAAQIWSGTNVTSGTATFFRIVETSDTGAASSEDVRMQGTVGLLAADLELSNVDLTNGAPLEINSASFTIPGSP